MAAQEELQILLKAVGAKDTEAALKNISGLLRGTGESAKGVGPGAKVASAALGELEAKGRGMADALGPAGSVLTSLGPAGLAAAAGIAATAGVATLAASALRDWTNALLTTTGNLSDQSAETGISTKALQEYAFIGSQVGVSQDALAASVLRMSRMIGEGSDETAAGLKKIGLSLDDLRGKSPEEQFKIVSAALHGISDSGQRAAASVKIFGRDTGILRVIASDTAALTAEFERLGLGLSGDAIEKFDAMGDELAKLDIAMTAFKNSVVQMVFGSADAAAAIRDLTALVAEAGAAARESAPLFSDLYSIITGSDLTTQIEQLRLLIAAARSVATFVRSGGKELSFSLPAASQKPAKPNALSNVGTKGGPSDAALKAAEERLKKLKELMDQLSGAAAQAQMNLLAEAFGKVGGLSGMAEEQVADLVKQVQALRDQGAEIPRAFDSLAPQFEQAGPPLSAIDTKLGELLEKARELSRANVGLPVGELGKDTVALRELGMVIDENTGLWTRYADVVDQELENATASTEEATQATIDWSSVLADVRNAFEVLGISADSFFGKILGGFASALAAAEKFKAAQKQGGTAGAVGMGLSGLQAAAGAYQSGSVLGGAASGAAFGASVGGPVGALIGGAAGGILGFFGGKARIKKELADLRQQLLQSVGGSMDELRKKAAALGVDISRAFTTKDPKELKRIMDALNKAAEEQKKRWEGVQTAVAGLTLRVKGFAAEMARSLRISENVGFADYFDTIRQKIDSGTLSLDVMTEATERQRAEFDRLGLFAVATFAGYIRESGDVIGALREMDAALGDLATAQELFGFTGSAALDQLLGLRAVVAANSEVADSIQGLNQLMQGLSDAGLNSAAIFGAFGSDAVELFTQMMEGGASANQAMALMQPTLQKLWEHQKKYGDITDEATLKLLAEAEAQGLVGEAMQSVNQQILDVLIAIGDVLGATIPQGLKRMGDAAEREFGRFGNAANSAGGHIPVNFPGAGGPEGGNPDGGGFAIGGTVHAPLSGQQITVHGTEHIFRPEQLTAVVSAAVERGYQAAVAQFAGAQAGGGDTILVMDGERIGRTMRRRAETGRDTPRRGPMVPRRR